MDAVVVCSTLFYVGKPVYINTYVSIIILTRSGIAAKVRRPYSMYASQI